MSCFSTTWSYSLNFLWLGEELQALERRNGTPVGRVGVCSDSLAYTPIVHAYVAVLSAWIQSTPRSAGH